MIPKSLWPRLTRPSGHRFSDKIMLQQTLARKNGFSQIEHPLVPAKAGTQYLALDSRLRGNERKQVPRIARRYRRNIPATRARTN
jgi:hypothetical protein